MLKYFIISKKIVLVTLKFCICIKLKINLCKKNEKQKNET